MGFLSGVSGIKVKKAKARGGGTSVTLSMLV